MFCLGLAEYCMKLAVTARLSLGVTPGKFTAAKWEPELSQSLHLEDSFTPLPKSPTWLEKSTVVASPGSYHPALSHRTGPPSCVYPALILVLLQPVHYSQLFFLCIIIYSGKIWLSMYAPIFSNAVCYALTHLHIFTPGNCQVQSKSCIVVGHCAAPNEQQEITGVNPGFVQHSFTPPTQNQDQVSNLWSPGCNKLAFLTFRATTPFRCLYCELLLNNLFLDSSPAPFWQINEHCDSDKATSKEQQRIDLSVYWAFCNNWNM